MISRLMGLDPVPVPPHVFAVDRRTLAYGRFVRAAAGSFELRDYCAVELPEGLFGDGPLGGPMREPAGFRPPLRGLLERVSGSVKEASLVLPDAWLRLAFTEVGELPRAPAQREEVLRWKLRRLVPFRVEELRLAGLEVAPLAGQEEPRRVLLGFGIDLLLRQLEEAFGAQGIRLGQISNQSLCLLAAARDALRDVALGALVLLGDSGYSLIFTLNGDPVLHRHKQTGRLADRRAAEAMVLRDLRLTREFLVERVPDARLGRVLVAAPEEYRAAWLGWLEQAFDLPAFGLGQEHLPLAGEMAGAALHETAPLLGAARQKVA